MIDWKLWKPYRPNPFKFVAADQKLWPFAWFYKHNLHLVKQQFDIQHVELSRSARQQLRTIAQTPEAHHLMICNHICFMDPHAVIELFRQSGGPKPYWMMGIEPMLTLRGFTGWYLSKVGTFSVDRGMVDKRSILYAQNTLDDRKAPLVVFAEGEADYNNHVLRPFYDGAFLLAINTLHRQLAGELPEAPIMLTPMVIQYPFLHSPEQSFNTDIMACVERLKADGEIITAHDSDSTEEKLLALLISGARQLAKRNQLPSQVLFEQALSKEVNVEALIASLSQLQQELLAQLCRLHLPDQEEVALTQQDFQAVMDLKNRLWSIINRKRFAPEPQVLNQALAQVATLEQNKALKPITQLEKQWIGLTYPEDNREKRLSRLSQHLKQQQPYSQLWAEQNEETLAQWKLQQEDTRRVKMLWLMIDDLKRGQYNKTWEAADELLTKIEIGFFATFKYRKNRQLVADVLEPIDVKAFCQARPELTKKKQQLLALGEEVERQIQAKLTQFQNLTIPLI